MKISGRIYGLFLICLLLAGYFPAATMGQTAQATFEVS
jgi:hypothetical protein